MHTAQAVVYLQDWGRREISTQDFVEHVRGRLAGVSAIRAVPTVNSGLTQAPGPAVQVAIGGSDYAELAQWRNRMLARMRENPGLRDPDSDYNETTPQLRVDIDRVRAAALGVSTEEVGSALATMMGSNRVTTFVEGGEEYDVILQARREDRATPADLSALHVRSQRGELVPLGNLIRLTDVAEPGSLARFNRLRAITLSAGLAPGYSLGEALDWMRATAAAELPSVARLDYKGQSREYLNAGTDMLFAFGMALLIVYLVLAAQFESFLHPLVIMLTVPFAALGALLGLWLWGGTLNLFSQIGIVMLIGLAAKNGVLIVEFANQLRDTGKTVREAVIEAAAVRLRPILMTSVATATGALPLVTVGGPGSASRANIGIVIISGVILSTLLTLYVVPSFYALLAPYTRSKDHLARRLQQLDNDTVYLYGDRKSVV